MAEVILAGANLMSVVHELVTTIFCPHGNKKPNCAGVARLRARARCE